MKMKRTDERQGQPNQDGRWQSTRAKILQSATRNIVVLLTRVQSVQRWGNRRANLYWERHLKAGHVPAEQ